MKKNYYAVKKGAVPGIYTDWESCKAQINGFSGAEYRGFATREEAVAFLELPSSVNEKQIPDSAGYSDPADACDPPAPLPGCAIAYVDGSFKESAGKFSYGIVLFTANADGSVKEMHLSKAFSNPELLEMRNVSGEIMGAAEAMKRAREMGLNEITIYHDYEGIAKWCQGLWKANKPWVIKYKAFYDDISQYIKINFVKVKGHSNDKYNDMADELAKSALEENL